MFANYEWNFIHVKLLCFWLQKTLLVFVIKIMIRYGIPVHFAYFHFFTEYSQQFAGLFKEHSSLLCVAFVCVFAWN